MVWEESNFVLCARLCFGLLGSVYNKITIKEKGINLSFTFNYLKGHSDQTKSVQPSNHLWSLKELNELKKSCLWWYMIHSINIFSRFFMKNIVLPLEQGDNKIDICWGGVSGRNSSYAIIGESIHDISIYIIYKCRINEGLLIDF